MRYHSPDTETTSAIDRGKGMWINVIGFAVAGVLVLPVAVVCVECLAALFGSVRGRQAAEARARVAVLIPAHNEEAVLAATLESVRPQLNAGDRLVVVADNCDDGTA